MRGSDFWRGKLQSERSSSKWKNEIERKRNESKQSNYRNFQLAKNCEILQQTVSGGIVSLMCCHSRVPKVFYPFEIMADSEKETFKKCVNQRKAEYQQGIRDVDALYFVRKITSSVGSIDGVPPQQQNNSCDSGAALQYRVSCIDHRWLVFVFVFVNFVMS